ncbi:hypothetical protein [Nocardia blacklockiae]|uniref:hypothetical protein n=1 Tax=Nocardia blacklockiae TaxID=480036 RepID=UPI00189336FB|nr:hypothetical protein [Nocardia blacklockiae]MBF6176013.1 hypothetical protein [Nocardia blacklockiae]
MWVITAERLSGVDWSADTFSTHVHGLSPMSVTPQELTAACRYMKPTDETRPVTWRLLDFDDVDEPGTYLRHGEPAVLVDGAGPAWTMACFADRLIRDRGDSAATVSAVLLYMSFYGDRGYLLPNLVVAQDGENLEPGDPRASGSSDDETSEAHLPAPARPVEVP